MLGKASVLQSGSFSPSCFGQPCLSLAARSGESFNAPTLMVRGDLSESVLIAPAREPGLLHPLQRAIWGTQILILHGGAGRNTLGELRGLQFLLLPSWASSGPVKKGVERSLCFSGAEGGSPVGVSISEQLPGGWVLASVPPPHACSCFFSSLNAKGFLFCSLLLGKPGDRPAER